jgi:hypothetical protein
VDLHDIVSMLTEIFTIVGLLGGIPLYIAGVSMRGFGGRWAETDGVIAQSARGPVIRWFDTDGDVHEAPADSPESAGLSTGDDIRVWFRPHTPSRGRTHPPEHDGKALRLTGLVLIGVGAGSAVLGIVLLFI